MIGQKKRVAKATLFMSVQNAADITYAAASCKSAGTVSLPTANLRIITQAVLQFSTVNTVGAS